MTIYSLDTDVFANALALDEDLVNDAMRARHAESAELVQRLFESLSNELKIGAPVVAELLTVRRGVDGRSGMVDELNELDLVWPLDVVASRYAGEIGRELNRIGVWPDAWRTREANKFDCLIAAITYRQKCQTLCTYNTRDFAHISAAIDRLPQFTRSLEIISPDELLRRLS